MSLPAQAQDSQGETSVQEMRPTSSGYAGEVDLINPELMMWRELVKRTSDVPGPFLSSETLAGELVSWLFGTQENQT
jgi:hypothetical protein